MLQTEYTENLFRSIDTIIAERIKNLPYDTTQLAEITDITNCQQGMYKVSADNQYEEIAYSDNPTYEVGDKVYVLTTSDKTRRFIIGIFQKHSSGRTDRVLSTLNQKIKTLDNSLTDKYLELKDETSQFMTQLSITAKELRSEYFDLNQGLNTLISQTAEEILLQAENEIEEKYANLSITAGDISTKVEDAINELETKINQTAKTIRFEAEDMKNGFEASLSITAEEIRSEVSSLLGTESSLSQTAEEIRAEVSNSLLGMESLLSQTAEEIRTEIKDINDDQASSIEQRIDEIKTQVKDTQLGMSEISQQTNNIISRVTDVEENFSYVQQMADNITSRVQSVEGNYSEIKQTTNTIQSRVEDINGYASEIEQKANSIRLEVLDPEEDGKGSKIQLTGDGIESQAKEIKFKGAVTFSDLKNNSSTEINGDYITTGYIDAKRIKAEEFNIAISSNEWAEVGTLGYGEGSSGSGTKTTGVMLAGPGGSNYFIATDAGIRMQGGETSLYCNDKTIKGDAVNIHFKADKMTKLAVNKCDCIVQNTGVQLRAWTEGNSNTDPLVYTGSISLYQPQSVTGDTTSPQVSQAVLMAEEIWMHGNIFGTDGNTITSDRNQKNNISYEMQQYENFYKLLKPAFYQVNHGTSNRYHIGYIYQDVEQALLKSKLTSQDFAGLVKTHNTEDGSLYCGLRYNEFIALNTYMIQKTRKELEEKNNKIQQLENKIDKLEQKLNLLLETLS